MDGVLSGGNSELQMYLIRHRAKSVYCISRLQGPKKTNSSVSVCGREDIYQPISQSGRGGKMKTIRRKESYGMDEAEWKSFSKRTTEGYCISSSKKNRRETEEISTITRRRRKTSTNEINQKRSGRQPETTPPKWICQTTCEYATR